MSAHHVRAGKARAAQFTPESQAAAARALVEKRGAGYMRTIGKRGARMFYRLYRWSPAGTRGWALINRSTKEIIATRDTLPIPNKKP